MYRLLSPFRQICDSGLHKIFQMFTIVNQERLNLVILADYRKAGNLVI